MGYIAEIPILSAIAAYEQEMRQRGFAAMDKSLAACLQWHNVSKI